MTNKTFLQKNITLKMMTAKKYALKTIGVCFRALGHFYHDRLPVLGIYFPSLVWILRRTDTV